MNASHESVLSHCSCIYLHSLESTTVDYSNRLTMPAFESNQPTPRLGTSSQTLNMDMCRTRWEAPMKSFLPSISVF